MKGCAGSQNTWVQVQQCPHESGNLSSHSYGNKGASARDWAWCGLLTYGISFNPLHSPLGKVLALSLIDKTARSFATCLRTLSGRGGILTWVRLILSFLFHAFSNHRYRGIVIMCVLLSSCTLWETQTRWKGAL